MEKSGEKGLKEKATFTRSSGYVRVVDWRTRQLRLGNIARSADRLTKHRYVLAYVRFPRA